MSAAELFSLALGAILINNFIFSRFLGICPFLGVSKKMSGSVGMGLAVIFVMTISSAATWAWEFKLTVENSAGLPGGASPRIYEVIRYGYNRQATPHVLQ